jgi:16S rRNA (cytosine967-C5)-methyltransferase
MARIARGDRMSANARPKRTTRRPPPPDLVSPERVVALRVMRRVAEGAYADRALAGEARAAHLDLRARSAAARLVFGAVQRRRTLDWLLDGAVENPEAVEPGVRDVLRLGAYELAWSDRVPPRAAVDQAVRLVRALPGDGTRAQARAGLVNAVLRRLSDEARPRLDELARDPANAAIVHSLPDWIASGLISALGATTAAEVMAAVNEPAESALRWNPLRGPRVGVTKDLSVPWHDDPLLPEAIVLEGPYAVEDSAAFKRGLVMGQSRASMLPARVLAPRPNERILDLCAAPGAKTTHMAALAQGGARITAVELHPARAKAMKILAKRMGARIDVIFGDALEADLEGNFDAVLVDPPCTGLGVLSARPDSRWRRREEALGPLVELQAALLERALGQVRPGGRVIYSTCTLLAAENEEIIRASGASLVDLTQRFPGMAHPNLPGALLTLPSTHRTDGFFVAELRAG